MAFIFHDWQIYNDARNLRKEIYTVTKKWPKEEKYILINQIRRASLSILLQIAEGSNRNTDKDKAAFFNRSHTAVDEVMACFDAALDTEYIDNKQYKYFYNKCENIAKQFRGLAKYLKKK